MTIHRMFLEVSPIEPWLSFSSTLSMGKYSLAHVTRRCLCRRRTTSTYCMYFPTQHILDHIVARSRSMHRHSTERSAGGSSSMTDARSKRVGVDGGPKIHVPPPPVDAQCDPAVSSTIEPDPSLCLLHLTSLPPHRALPS
jgi:hypothetical protein